MKQTSGVELQKLAYSIAEAARILGVSQGHLRNENRRGKLRFVKSGRRVLITREDLNRYLSDQGHDQAQNAED